MTRFAFAGLFALLVAAAVPAQEEKKAEDKKAADKKAEDEKWEVREKALRLTRENYYTAFYRGDTAAMGKIESNKFDVYHDRKGDRQDTADWRKDIDTLVKAKEWTPKRLMGETTTVFVRLTTTSATVSGRGLVENADPKKAKEFKAFTEFWDEVDGKWRLTHLHYNFGSPEDEKE